MGKGRFVLLYQLSDASVVIMRGQLKYLRVGAGLSYGKLQLPACQRQPSFMSIPRSFKHLPSSSDTVRCTHMFRDTTSLLLR